MKGQGPKSARILLGYAGWGPGQLESEISRNGWLTVTAIPDLVFNTDYNSKWNMSVKSLGINPLCLSGASGLA